MSVAAVQGLERSASGVNLRRDDSSRALICSVRASALQAALQGALLGEALRFLGCRGLISAYRVCAAWRAALDRPDCPVWNAPRRSENEHDKDDDEDEDEYASVPVWSLLWPPDGAPRAIPPVLVRNARSLQVCASLLWTAEPRRLQTLELSGFLEFKGEFSESRYAVWPGGFGSFLSCCRGAARTLRSLTLVAARVTPLQRQSLSCLLSLLPELRELHLEGGATLTHEFGGSLAPALRRVRFWVSSGTIPTRLHGIVDEIPRLRHLEALCFFPVRQATTLRRLFGCTADRSGRFAAARTLRRLELHTNFAAEIRAVEDASYWRELETALKAALQDGPPLELLHLRLPENALASSAIYRGLSARGCRELTLRVGRSSRHVAAFLEREALPAGLKTLQVSVCTAALLAQPDAPSPCGAAEVVQLKFNDYCHDPGDCILQASTLERLAALFPALQRVRLTHARAIGLTSAWLADFNASRKARGLAALRVCKEECPFLEKAYEEL